MYEIDERDRVVELKEVTPPDVIAPLPLVISKEGAVVLSYIASRYVGVIVSFPVCHAHYFGPPGEDAFKGHPLAARGMKCHSVYEVQESSWIRALERSNRLPSKERDKNRSLGDWKHFAFPFRDALFECVARDYGVELNRENDDMLKVMSRRLYL